ncbi:DUF4126 family protein [Rhizobium rhizophilum]|uniref:DUF4126 family protein n=1 Tax=Rhizobium rhizophilum TaxID=1850373 RepID=A0ABY2QSN6_9HYPH|nr:DUF4126 family protein [Rhizobium rhizophilum]THV12680.1 DUF4126 family protein [Rhizobium rhizophilum]
MLALLTLMIGIVAGLRAMTAPAAIAWAAYLGWLDYSQSSFSFIGSAGSVLALSILAFAEFIADQLPSTPSRRVPVQFGTRLFTGAFSGAAIMAVQGHWLVGLALGTLGAVLGTLGGASVRNYLAGRLGSDRPAALIEDAIAIVTAVLTVAAVS